MAPRQDDKGIKEKDEIGDCRFCIVDVRCEIKELGDWGNSGI